MRQAGTLPNEVDAQRFIDYLLTQGIESKFDPGTSDCAIWIYDETQLAQSKQELVAFSENPADPRYAGATAQAQKLRAETAAARKKAAGNIVDVRERWGKENAVGRRPVTFALIAISVLVAIITNAGKDLAPIDPYLFIAKITDNANPPYLPGLQEVRHGEIWRLVTPIFIHMDFWHLLFNMYWMLILGGMIEVRRGSVRFLGLVLASAALSNFAQYAYSGPSLILFGNPEHGGPFFGGMSGVNYALFGYAWIRPRVAWNEPRYLHPQTVFLFLLWFFVCLSGSAGPIANVAHGVGLLVGMAAGALPLLTRMRG